MLWAGSPRVKHGRGWLRDLRRVPDALTDDVVEVFQERLSAFVDALADLADGYIKGCFEGRAWSVTTKRSPDGKRICVYGEELGGRDIVSFNFYRLSATGPTLKPCEMSSATVIDFVLGFEPEPRKKGPQRAVQSSKSARG